MGCPANELGREKRVVKRFVEQNHAGNFAAAAEHLPKALEPHQLASKMIELPADGRLFRERSIRKGDEQ
jgi:hypothetical protein